MLKVGYSKTHAEQKRFVFCTVTLSGCPLDLVAVLNRA